ncbi:hypothetical protein VNO77_15515 [Canavalia gladiata]|uniref:Uncharacterized protein n=1 Tax=Canavalia gladiata TaxID=3824 RepID=A0AAN9QRE7_CANGL
MGTGVNKVQGFSHILKHLWTYLGRLGFVCLHALIVLANEFLHGMDPALQRLRTMEGASPAISNLLPLVWSSTLCLFPSLLSSISSSLGPLPRNSNQRPETSPQPFHSIGQVLSFLYVGRPLANFGNRAYGMTFAKGPSH